MSLMYENTHTWNPFAGCRHECVYCYAKKVAKRQKHRCIDCYNFVPHEHPERLGKKFPKGSQVFVCSMGDIAFATVDYRKKIYDAIEKQPNVTFLLQSKNPGCFIRESDEMLIPNNTIIGTTIETTYDDMISHAPRPHERYRDLCDVNHPQKYVTIEPIMRFEFDTMVQWIYEIHPEFVYIGYDNHKHRLPEPSIGKTLKLMERLEEFTEVRRKIIRKAWWEE